MIKILHVINISIFLIYRVKLNMFDESKNNVFYGTERVLNI